MTAKSSLDNALTVIRKNMFNEILIILVDIIVHVFDMNIVFYLSI